MPSLTAMQPVLTRLSPDVIEQVNQVAVHEGLNRSMWIRQAILKALREADGRCVTCGGKAPS